MLRTFKSIFLLLLLSIVPAFGQHLTTSEAGKHVGEQATVCGKIASERTATQSRGQPTFINLDRPYPNQVFTAVIWEEDKANVGAVPSSGDICVSGLITQYHGVPEIVLHDAKDWSSPTGHGHQQTQLSNDNRYTNSDGQSVHSPAYSSSGVPAGATALCSDGTYSFSQHRQGTCSHHGGVAKWLQ